MRYLLVLFVLLNNGRSVSAQDYNWLYLGEVNPCTAEDYLEKAKWIYDPNIAKSPYKIHILLDEYGSPGYFHGVFELYLDTVFTLKYGGYVLSGDKGLDELWDTLLHVPAPTIDSLFRTLVSNGIFSLPLLTSNQIMETYEPLVLDSGNVVKSIKAAALCGMRYMLVYKVGNYYGQLALENPAAFSQSHPDNTIFKRQAGIVNAFYEIRAKYGIKRQDLKTIVNAFWP